MSSPIAIEAAKSARGSCVQCGEKFPKGELKAGTMAWGVGGMQFFWRHPHCFLKTLEISPASTSRGKCTMSKEFFEKGEIRLGLPAGKVGKTLSYIQIDLADCISEVVKMVPEFNMRTIKGFEMLSHPQEWLELFPAASTAVLEEGKAEVEEEADVKQEVNLGVKTELDAEMKTEVKPEVSTEVTEGEAERDTEVKVEATGQGAAQGKKLTKVQSWAPEVPQETGAKLEATQSFASGSTLSKSQSWAGSASDGGSALKRKQSTASQESTPKLKKKKSTVIEPPPKTELKRKPDPEGTSALLISWNVDGIRAKGRRDALHQLLEEHSPDVLAVQETKLQVKDEADWADVHPQYEASFSSSDTPAKLGYAGTVVYVRKTVTAPKVTMGIHATADPKVLWQHEGRAITVELDNFFLVNLYVINSGSGVLVRLPDRIEKWDPRLREYVRELEQRKPVVVTGDLNVAHRDEDIWNVQAPHIKKQPGCTDEERTSFGKLLSADGGMVDTFRDYHPDATGW
eukprot:TRINITY_DN10673_c0_g1_i2.p1 TRINITY_DN10673_c0_g1~~TRINITY_DN10673_c0_g1_i2.p1  ORF type:complete len:514 (+),score=104.15 TRINITY_DN10673_c0_g1_i2:221-1762(+)